MAYSPDVLLKIVELGGNLEIYQACSPQALEKIITAAKETGAKVKIKGKYSPGVIYNLVSIGGDNVTIVCE